MNSHLNQWCCEVTMGSPVTLTHFSRSSLHGTWSRGGFFGCKLLICFVRSVSARYILNTGKESIRKLVLNVGTLPQKQARYRWTGDPVICSLCLILGPLHRWPHVCAWDALWFWSNSRSSEHLDRIQSNLCFKTWPIGGCQEDLRFLDVSDLGDLVSIPISPSLCLLSYSM